MNIRAPVPKCLVFVLVAIFFAVIIATGCIEPTSPDQNTTGGSPTVTAPAGIVTAPAGTINPTETTPAAGPENATEVPGTLSALPENTTSIPAATSPVPPGNSTPAVTYLTYSNASYGFSIDYPSDWTVNDAPVANPSDPASPPGFEPKIDVVEFYSPAITRCNNGDCVLVRSEVHVEVDPSPSTTVLSDYYVKDVAAISQGEEVDITGHNAMFKLSGQNAYRLDFKTGYDISEINIQRAYTIIGGKAYVITFHAHAPYSGEVDQFEEYYNTAQDMFKSFQTTASLKVL